MQSAPFCNKNQNFHGKCATIRPVHSWSQLAASSSMRGCEVHKLHLSLCTVVIPLSVCLQVGLRHHSKDVEQNVPMLASPGRGCVACRVLLTACATSRDMCPTEVSDGLVSMCSSSAAYPVWL
jgi:hypothetical protein